MSKTTLPCPKCDLRISVFEDTADCVGATLAGFYVSHPLWGPYPTATSCPGYLAADLLPKTGTREECVAQWESFAGAMAAEGDIVVARLKLAKAISDLSHDHPTHRFVLSDRAQETAERMVQEAAGIMASYARMADERFIVFTDGIGSTEGAALQDLPEGMKGKGGTSFGEAMRLLFADKPEAGPLHFANVRIDGVEDHASITDGPVATGALPHGDDTHSGSHAPEQKA